MKNKHKFAYYLEKKTWCYPAGIYLLKVNNRDTRTRCEICSKLRKIWISFLFFASCILSKKKEKKEERKDLVRSLGFSKSIIFLNFCYLFVFFLFDHTSLILLLFWFILSFVFLLIKIPILISKDRCLDIFTSYKKFNVKA